MPEIKDQNIDGGQLAIRGFLAQTLICLLEMLETQDWESVTLEPNLSSTKVDILWVFSGGKRKAVQVKSSINQINVSHARQWEQDLIKWKDADIYELQLLGFCSQGVVDGWLGQIVSIPTPKSIQIRDLFFIAAHKLGIFLGKKGKVVSPFILEDIIENLIYKLLDNSVNGKLIERTSFEELFQNLVNSCEVNVLRSFTLKNLPRKTDFLFGRKNELSQVADCFHGENLRIVSLVGLGGSGKTQVALHYASELKDKYSYIFWCQADSERTLLRSYGAFGAAVGVSESQDVESRADIFKQWLGENSGWLLVLDNYSSIKNTEKFIPFSFEGKIIITSREIDFSSLGQNKIINIGMLSLDDSVDFLFQRTSKLKSSQEETSAIKLAEELGGLPLALEQAGAFIVSKKVSISMYLNRFVEHRLNLLEKSKPIAGDYRETVRTTWRINFEQILEESIAAIHLLYVFAFYHHKQIPLRYVETACTLVSPQTAQALKDSIFIQEVIEPLFRYSLINIQEDFSSFDYHLLTQEVVIESMDDELKLEVWKIALSALDQERLRPDFNAFNILTWINSMQSTLKKGVVFQFVPENLEEINLFIDNIEGVKPKIQFLTDLLSAADSFDSPLEYSNAFKNVIVIGLDMLSTFENSEEVKADNQNAQLVFTEVFDHLSANINSIFMDGNGDYPLEKILTNPRFFSDSIILFISKMKALDLSKNIDLPIRVIDFLDEAISSTQNASNANQLVKEALTSFLISIKTDIKNSLYK